MRFLRTLTKIICFPLPTGVGGLSRARPARSGDRSHCSLGWLAPLALLLLLTSAALAEDVPAGWTATPLEAFDRLPLAVLTPPAALLRTDFSQFKLSLTRDVKISGQSLLWEFTANKAAAQPALVLGKASLPTTLACDGFALYLKNPAQYPLQLYVRLTDTSGETWRSQAVPLGDHKGWFQYLFPFTDFTGMGSKLPAAPYQALELVVSGLKQGEPYSLYVDELRALSAPPPDLRLSGLTAPREVVAGRSLPVRATLKLSGEATRPVQLLAQLSAGSVPVACTQTTVVADPRQAQSLDLAVPVPTHIASGNYRLSLTCSGAALAEPPAQDVAVQAAAPLTRITANSPAHGGTFAIDGVPLPLVGGAFASGAMPRQAPWVMVPCTADFDATGQSETVWLGPDKFSYAALDARLAAVLSANPDAYLIPVVYLSSPPWWDQQHPRELMVFGDGKTTLPESVPGAKRTFASWASPVWRKDASAALTRLLQHLEESPFAPAIVGYQLASGENGRWAYPGASQGVFADYGHPQQEAFRAWLKAKYTDVKTLRVAWSQPALPVNTPEALKEIQPIMGWKQARIPDQNRRLRGPSGVLHDPTAAQEIIDYQIFASDEVVDTIRFFAGVAREATGKRKPIGAAYGQIFDLAATRCGVQNGGHLSLAPACEAEELDFLVSDSTRDDPAGPPLLATAHNSVTNHGKVWITLAAGQQGLGGLVGGLSGGGMVAQQGYAPEKLPRALPSLPPTLDRSSVADVAVIIDDISAAYTSCGPELMKSLLCDQRVSLSLMGAPVDVWTLDDLMGGRAAGYKEYLFLDCFYLDGQWRKQLVDLLGQQPCTAVWVYAPGAIDQAIGGRTMKDLTGLTLVQRAEKGLLQVKAGDGYTYGSPLSLSPRFVCVDDKADLRGFLAGTTLGGLAVGVNGTTKSVWSAAPHLPAGLLRGIASDADVHLYCDDGDGVYLNRSLIAIRAAADGEHVVRLPRLAQVYDLASGKAVGSKASEFRVRLRAGQIGLYYYGDAPLVER